MAVLPVYVVVTGANRGLGLAIVKQLVEHPPVKPIQILACARNPPKDQNFEKTVDASAQWCTLDIGSSKSITEFSNHVKKTCPDGLDVLINNAGVNLDQTTKHGIEPATQTIDINYNGTREMIGALIPLMRRPGHQHLGHSRIVNVSSVASKLRSSEYPQSTRQAFQNAASMTDVENLRDRYLRSVAKRCERVDGWPVGRSYNVSKALMNAATQVLATENEDLLINACCPGWIDTDMGSLVGKPSKSARDGAKIPLKLAFGKIEESGKYWENPSVFGTADGQVAEWS